MNAMLQTKMRNFLLGLFLSIFLLVNSSVSFAQTPAAVPTIPQVEFNPDSFEGDIGAQTDANTIGITCGIPESLNRSEGTRCCNTNVDTEALIQEPLNRTPNYFCLGGALSAIAGAGGGFFDIFTAPFETLGNLFSGHFSDAFSSALNMIPGLAIAKGVVKGIKAEDICLSDAVKLMVSSSIGSNPFIAMKKPPIAPQPCMEGAHPTSEDYASASCKCVPAKEDENGVSRLCSLYMRESSDMQICGACAASGGYWTGIGCLKTDLVGFTGSIIGVGIGVGGAATLLCIIYAAFILQTSRGNPEKIKKAQESLRACISGLLLIIFSIFILRLIGVTILQIPGLS